MTTNNPANRTNPIDALAAQGTRARFANRSATPTGSTAPTNATRSLRHMMRRALGLPAVGHAGPAGIHAGFEHLEGRLVLSGSPFPTVSELESPNNTVIRFATTYGDIDIEMFNSAATVTVNNFVSYVTSGRMDGTFFHRAVDQGFDILQGGGFTFSNSSGVSSVPTDAAIVRENSGRANAARTIAMARTSQLNSATSQFYFNITDNPEFDITGPNNGYTVFGRIIRGWEIVEEMAARPIVNAAGQSVFNNTGIGGELPVTAAYDANVGVRKDSLITLIDAEIIKPAGATGFYLYDSVFPEGFSSGTSTESLDISNPNSAVATVQIIARFETGRRDQVLSTVTIAAGATQRINLSTTGVSSLAGMRVGTPYSLVVQTALPNGATSPKPVSATLTRSDYNAEVAEALVSPSSMDSTSLNTWLFPRIERNALSREYLVWTNLSDQDGQITITFTTSQGEQTFSRTVEALRRGGLEVFSLGLPQGTLSAKITSTVPIVAALSDWDLPSPGVTQANAHTPGFSMVGVAGGGSVRGGLADLAIKSGHTDVISFANDTSTAANVTLTFVRGGNNAAITRTYQVAGRSRLDISLEATQLGMSVGDRFSVFYDSDRALAGQYVQVNEAQRHQSSTTRSGFARPFATGLAAETRIAGAILDTTRTDGTTTQRLVIFNPFAQTGSTLAYNIKFHFADGSVIEQPTANLGPSGRIEIDLNSIPTLKSKVQSSAQFRAFAISVTGTTQDLPGGDLTTGGLVSLTRYDANSGRSVVINGSAMGAITPFSDDRFE
jgi:cyclophilin family peptidyl-prolyl cis-trans isomerase